MNGDRKNNYIQFQRRYLNVDRTPVPIRIKPLFLLGSIEQKYKDIIKAGINIALKYLSDVFKVFPLQENLKVEDNEKLNNGKVGTCIKQSMQQNISIPKYLSSEGISNTDLLIIVTQKHDPQKDYQASAETCQMYNDRSTVGVVTFNMDHFYTSYKIGNGRDFEDNLANRKRFTTQQIDQFYMNETIRGISTPILGSPEVLKTTRRYFGCDSAKGAQLENDGVEGSKGSHWEKTIFLNELMNPNILITGTIPSIFTLAYFQDSNWYADIDYSYAEDIQWGYKKGCEFLNSCDGKFPEFSYTSQYDCDYHYQGLGEYQKQEQSDCKVVTTTKEDLCSNPSIQKQFHQDNTYEKFASGSKCFKSNFKGQNKQGSKLDLRCYQQKCNSSGHVEIIINVNGSDKKLTCTSDGQTLQAPAGMIGTLTCPRSLSEFCMFHVPCENYCSEKGYCQKQNGKSTCHCIAGYAGQDCSQKCDGYINSSGQCVSSCGQGFYFNRGTKVCGKCDNNCSNCNGPQSSQCTSCIQGQFSHQGQCVNLCPQGTFVNLNNNSCQKCDASCTTGCIRSQSNCIVLPFVYRDEAHLAEELKKDLERLNNEKNNNDSLIKFQIFLLVIIFINISIV